MEDTLTHKVRCIYGVELTIALTAEMAAPWLFDQLRPSCRQIFFDALSVAVCKNRHG